MFKKILKRIFVFSTLCLLLSSFPLTVSAEESIAISVLDVLVPGFASLRNLVVATAGQLVQTIVAALGSFLENTIISLMYPISTVILGISSFFFNVVFQVTLVSMQVVLKNFPTINVIWKIFRDLGNIVMIFSLLYVAISMILGADGHATKSMLSKIIIVGLLINFSMFFTKAIIDVGNILALGFYEKIQVNGTAKLNQNNADFMKEVGGIELLNTLKISATNSKNLADGFVSAYNFQKITKDDVLQGYTGLGVADSIKNNFNTAQSRILRFLIGIWLIVIVSIIFAAAAFMFLKRFMVLTVLIMISPLAFIAILIPGAQGEELSKKFWSKLIAETLAAPVFMFMVWLGFKVMADPAFKAALKPGPNTPFISISTFFSYGVVNIILVSALVMCHKIGASGAASAISFYQGAKGWVGTNTVGRVSNTIRNKAFTNSFIQNGKSGLDSNNKLIRNPLKRYTRMGIAKGADAILKNLSGKSYNSVPDFGGHGHDANAGGHGDAHGPSAEHNVHEIAEKMKMTIEENHGDAETVANVFMAGGSSQGPFGTLSDDLKAKDHVFHEMSIEDKLNFKQVLEQILTDSEEIKKAKEERETLAKKPTKTKEDVTRIKELDKKIKKDAKDNNKDLADFNMMRYFTGHGGVGRNTPEQATQLERMETEKVTAVQNKQFRDKLTAVHQAQAPETKVQATLELDLFLSKLTEKQRAAALTQVPRTQQVKLYEDKDVQKVLHKNITTLNTTNMIKNAGTASAPLEKMLSDIGYDGKARFETVEKLGKNPAKFETLSKEHQKELKDLFISAGIKEKKDDGDDKTIEEIMNEYKEGEVRKNDETFVRGKENYTRVFTSTDRYNNVSKILDTISAEPKPRQAPPGFSVFN